MSKAILNILTNDSNVTTLLGNGSSSIFSEYAPQEESRPHIIIKEDQEIPFDTFSGPSTVDDVQLRIESISPLKYTDNINGVSISGAKDIAEAVRSSLDYVIKGTYGGEVVRSLVFIDSNTNHEPDPQNPLVVVEQEYQFFKGR